MRKLLRFIIVYIRLHWWKFVCAKAFASIHGITKGKLELYIQKALISTGQSPQDARDTRKNRPRKMTKSTLDRIEAHIKTFKEWAVTKAWKSQRKFVYQRNSTLRKCQLLMYNFNVHILLTGKSAFYIHPETVAKKVSNAVASFYISLFTIS